MKKQILFSMITIFSLQNIISQTQPAQLKYTASDSYILVERTDLRRYDNGKYIGLMSREIRSFITPEYKNQEETFYDGNFYVLEKTRRNMTPAARGLNKAIPSKFKIQNDGELIMILDNGFPSFRSFPSYNDSPLFPGDEWYAYAQRSVDPLNKNIPTRTTMYVEYRFLKEEIYHNEEVYILSAKWASRYGGENIDPEGDPDLISIKGKHDATIFISKTNGRSLLIRDQLDETFFYTEGKQINFKGTISMFTEYPPSYNTENLYKTINSVTEINERSLKELENNTITSQKQNISISKTSAGLVLNIQDLKFLPDSAELLPEENDRLSAIYEILSQCPQNSFLIEGHTADTGNPKGEQELSLQRAYSIASKLISLGISEDKIICKGSGAEKPIAGNDTPEGRAKNRRVEITILGS